MEEYKLSKIISSLLFSVPSLLPIGRIMLSLVFSSIVSPDVSSWCDLSISKPKIGRHTNHYGDRSVKIKKFEWCNSNKFFKNISCLSRLVVEWEFVNHYRLVFGCGSNLGLFLYPMMRVYFQWIPFMFVLSVWCFG